MQPVVAPELNESSENVMLGAMLSQSQQALDWNVLSQDFPTVFGQEVAETWLAPLEPLGLSGGVLTLAAPTSFFVMQVKRKYQAELEQLIEAKCGRKIKIEIDVVPASMRPKAAPVEGALQPAKVEQLVAELGAKSLTTETANPAWQYSSKLDPRYKFETFVTGKSNTFAFTACQGAAQNLIQGATPLYNPLFMHGGVGLGKTHLMQAIAHSVLAALPQTQVMYLSAEQFLNKFIKAMQDKTQQRFKEIFRGVDVLMIDDIQFIAGKDNTQEEFFHTFNHLIGEGKLVILTADRPPQELGLEERLKSRLGSGLTMVVHAPEEETRLAILRTKAEQMKAEIPAEVLGLLASSIASNVRELEGALNRLVAYNRLTGIPITEGLAREHLRDLFKAYTRVVTIDEIKQRVAIQFNVRLADLNGARRTREIARPRQVAMYLAKKMTQRSYPEIGRSFGGRDHTTVMHACQQIENLLPRDAQLAEQVVLLTNALNTTSLARA